MITKSFANQKCWSFFSNTHSLYFRVLFFSYFNFLFAKGTSFWQKFSFMIELFLCYIDEILFFSTKNLVLNGRILQKCTFYLTCLVSIAFSNCLFKRANYMEIFNPIWNFSLVYRGEVSSQLNSKLLFKMKSRLHFKISTRYTHLYEKYIIHSRKQKI